MTWVLSIIGLLAIAANTLADESIDASDPTKIYSYAGPGYKYTEFSNGDNRQELRVIGKQHFDKDRKLFKPSAGSNGPNDWNIFAAINFYF